jgi:polysaccharide biosynthesis/export protein
LSDRDFQIERRGDLKKTLFCLYILFSVCITAEAQSSKESLTVTSTDAKPTGPAYTIGLEDILSVNVWKEPDLSLKEVVVRPDGKISLPLLNEIQAQGLTTRQLQDKIAEKLREFVANPNVTVIVVKIVSQSVSVVGQVNRPGSFPIGAPITVIELLARAGGLTDYAKSKEIRVIRTENGQTLQFPVNYKDIIKGKNLNQNIMLRAGDVVLVP